MSLTIDLTPSEETRISVIARQTGLALVDWVKNLVEENLGALPCDAEQEGSTPFAKLMESNGATSNVSTDALFAIWAKEDAEMTDAERLENERIYA